MTWSINDMVANVHSRAVIDHIKKIDMPKISVTANGNVECSSYLPVCGPLVGNTRITLVPDCEGMLMSMGEFVNQRRRPMT